MLSASQIYFAITISHKNSHYVKSTVNYYPPSPSPSPAATSTTSTTHNYSNISSTTSSISTDQS